MSPQETKDEPGAPPPPEDPGRRLTIDDVPRLGSGTGIAIGCALFVILAVIAFWLIRGWLIAG